MKTINHPLLISSFFPLKIRIRKLFYLDMKILSLSRKKRINRLRASEGEMLRKIFEPTTEKITGECEGFHNENLRNCFSHSSIN
jgi:hypothetical protein